MKYRFFEIDEQNADCNTGFVYRELGMMAEVSGNGMGKMNCSIYAYTHI